MRKNPNHLHGSAKSRNHSLSELRLRVQQDFPTDDVDELVDLLLACVEDKKKANNVEQLLGLNCLFISFFFPYKQLLSPSLLAFLYKNLSFLSLSLSFFLSLSFSLSLSLSLSLFLFQCIIFNLHSRGDSSLDRAILDAIILSRTTDLTKVLRQAMIWNRADVARNALAQQNGVSSQELDRGG